MPGPDGSLSLPIKQAIEALATTTGWERHFPELRTIAPKIVPQLLEGLKSANSAVRKWCVDLLVHSDHSQADHALFEALNDPIADVRRHAVLAIAMLARNRSWPDVAVTLSERVERDSSVLVQRVAAHVIGQLPPDRRAAEPLQRAFQKAKDAKLRRSLWQAIGQHGMATP